MNHKAMSHDQIRKIIVGAGIQDDWWTGIAPDLERSAGSYLYDTDGRPYLDLMTFFATSPISYDHPRLKDPEFMEKLARVALHKPSNSDFWTAELAEFVDALHRIAQPHYLPYLFFISGGGLAVENALKTAFDWKVRRNIQKGVILKPDFDQYQEAKQLPGTRVLYFDEAFHGRTGYTLSMTHTFDPRKYKYFPKFDWPRLPNPKLSFPLNEENVNKAVEAERRTLNLLKGHLHEDPHGFAAIIIEPIQGEGGDNHFRPEFFRELRALADENDLLLIYDEVQTGMGITGTMWAHEQFGEEARPDLLCFAKRFQVAGVMGGGKVAQVEDHVFSNREDGRNRLNSTFGGNLVDMVRCQRYLEIIEEENLLNNAVHQGARLLKGLEELATDSPLSNVRGRGSMIAFDLPTTEKRNLFRDKMQKNGLLAMSCGARTIRFRPHLDITAEEVDEALSRLKRTLEKDEDESVQ